VNKTQVSCRAAEASRVERSDAWRREVRRTYARAATCAAAVVPGDVRPASRAPHSGLGCGSPTTFAGLAPGEWVLDLGSGAGFDCLAASVEVGSAGRVVGIDMTPEMVRLARRHAADAGVRVAHFLQADIGHLPFADETFDVVMSNCVINLCADQQRALAEAWRVLKPGGRLAVADIVALTPLPAPVLAGLAARTGCVAGAVPMERLPAMLRAAGFESDQIVIEEHSCSLLCGWAPGRGLDRHVAAARITAAKPGAEMTGGVRRDVARSASATSDAISLADGIPR